MNVFLMHMGRLVKQTSVDQDGRFVFNNVRQGAYALTGWGDRGLFTFGLNILADNPNAVDNAPPNSITVTAFQNQTTINTDWITHYAPQVGFRVFGKYLEGEGAKNDPALYGALGLYNNPPENSPATSISSHVVGRSSDGHLVGRIHQFNSTSGRPVDLRSTKVLLLENDSVVAATAADNFGVFEFEQVPAGSYGVLAAGVDGVGLIAITVDDESDETDTIDFTLIPTETVGWLNSYAAEVAYRRNASAPRQPKPNDAVENILNRLVANKGSRLNSGKYSAVKKCKTGLAKDDLFAGLEKRFATALTAWTRSLRTLSTRTQKVKESCFQCPKWWIIQSIDLRSIG